MELRVEIIGIGNELITGRILDQNAGYAAARLHSFGFEVTRILFVGDYPQAIRTALKEAQKSADAVLVTGGLGGTLDDITVEVVSRVFNRPLVLHPDLESQLKRYLTKELYPLGSPLRKNGLAAGRRGIVPSPAEGLWFYPGMKKGNLSFSFPGSRRKCGASWTVRSSPI